MTRLVVPLLIGVLGAATLVALGVWQVQRLAWKEGLLAEIESRMARQPIALPEHPVETAHRFTPVAVTGTLDGPPILVFTSVKGQGVRHRMIQPVATENGRRILLERGLVRPEDTRDLPIEGPVTIEGLLHWPDELDSFTPPPDPTTGVYYARDLAGFSARLGTEPVLVVARKSTPDDPRIRPLPLDPAGIPNDHLQYAVTWFGLAAVWVAMTGLWLRRLTRAAHVKG